MTQNERIGLPIWKKIILIIITLIVFIIQMALIIATFQLEFNIESQTLYYIVEILAFCFVLRILNKPMLTSYKLTWTILILTFPLPFMALYVLNKISRIVPKKQQEKINKVLQENIIENCVIKEIEDKHPKTAKLAKIVNSSGGYALYKNTKFTFIKDGLLKFEDTIKEIKKAKKYIFIETFILGEGYLLDTLLPILKEKGEAGVEIKILYDDLGSKQVLSPKKVKELASIPNCQITNYNPIDLVFNPVFNYRDHRKIIVIDGKVAYCGGDNLADEYIHKKTRFGYWRDNCGKYEGDAVRSFISLFLEVWFLSTKQELKLEDYVSKTNIVNEDSFVLPFGDGPLNKEDPAYDLFKALINSANKTLYISTPYFIIDNSVIDELCLSAKSGVDVRILMPSHPDKKSAFYLARYHYGKLIKSGVKIYEYTPGFNHAKNIMVDGKFAFIGTINMDYRSLFLHYECGALIALDEEINKMDEDFIKTCQESKQISYQDWLDRPWWQKIIAYLLYIISPMF